MLTLRDEIVPRKLAIRSLPRFPEQLQGRTARKTKGLLDSRAERHARRAWDDARRYAINRSMTASVVTDGNPGGLLELVMVSALADHTRSCPHCWHRSTWSGDRPGDWITWATMNSRLRAFLVIAGQEVGKATDEWQPSSPFSVRVEPKPARKQGERWVRLALEARARREAMQPGR